MIARASRRRCPRCGGPAYDTYFELKKHCDVCGVKFEREEGYWVGSMIINTTLTFTTFILIFGGSILATWPDVPWGMVLVVTLAANVAIPILFYPLSKTLWMAFDLTWHPLEQDEIAAAAERAQGVRLR